MSHPPPGSPAPPAEHPGAHAYTDSLRFRTGHRARGWAREGLVVVLGVAVLFSGASFAWTVFGGKTEAHRRIDEAIEIISSVHVDQPTETDLSLEAVRGMIASLDDRHALYIPRSDVAEFHKDLEGEYSGIGALIGVRDGLLVIVTPLEDSPAYRAGLLPDDHIVAVDGKLTVGFDTTDAVELLLGEEGTTVTLTIERPSSSESPEPERFDVDVVRAPIVTRTIKGVRRDPGDPETWLHTLDPSRAIAYVRITQFTPSTAQDFDQALASVPDAQGLIIDVRGNPGGLMGAAIHIADRLLSEGVIVASRGPAVGETIAAATRTDDDFKGDVIVLIDAQSASASEILAGAIVGNERGAALGTRTFGKGSVQGVYVLSDRSEIKLTQALYEVATPAGGTRPVDRRGPGDAVWGVDPNEGMHVTMTFDEMLAAREASDTFDRLGQGKGEPLEASVDWSDVTALLEARADPQLAAAHDAIAAKIDTGQWARPGNNPPTTGDLRTQERTALESAREALLDRLAEIDDRLNGLTPATTADDNPSDDTEEGNTEEGGD